jgi:hypothetical protein
MAIQTTPQHSAKQPAPAGDGRVEVENVNVPGHIVRLDAGMYAAMRKALLKVLPARAPGLTEAEMRAAVLPHLPAELFPGGAKAGWWAKSVQLDLEAKQLVIRESTKPLRWHRAPRR